MQRLELTTNAQLAMALGWTSFNGPTKAGRLRRGAHDAQFSTILPLLLAADLLEPEATRVVREQAEDAWSAIHDALDRARRLADEEQLPRSEAS